MKHRLPKAKISLPSPENNPGLEQSELLIGEKDRQDAPPIDVPSATTPQTETPLPVNDAPAPPSFDAPSPDAPQPFPSFPEPEPVSVHEPAPANLPGPDDALPPAENFVPHAEPLIDPLETPEAIQPPKLPTEHQASETFSPEPEVVAPPAAMPPPLSMRSISIDEPSPVQTAPAVGTALQNLSEGHAPFLIQTQGLVKQYGGRRVVNGVDIHVRAGEVVGLLGKNGAGKTTTFYMIVGLVPPTQGHVFMGDEDVTRMPMYRRARCGIGYLPQEESIFRKLSVEDNLLAILETLPITEEERENRCDELLKDFGLEHVRENIAITLSGGEKRRVTIARALVTSPTLLLLDEPFSGVDPMAVHDIQEIILHLKERGLGVLITDHNVRETLSVVDRAYIINEGRVLSQGTREFLLNDPIAREIYLGHRFSM